MIRVHHQLRKCRKEDAATHLSVFFIVARSSSSADDVLVYYGEPSGCFGLAVTKASRAWPTQSLCHSVSEAVSDNYTYKPPPPKKNTRSTSRSELRRQWFSVCSSLHSLLAHHISTSLTRRVNPSFMDLYGPGQHFVSGRHVLLHHSIFFIFCPFGRHNLRSSATKSARHPSGRVAFCVVPTYIMYRACVSHPEECACTRTYLNKNIAELIGQ